MKDFFSVLFVLPMGASAFFRWPRLFLYLFCPFILFFVLLILSFSSAQRLAEQIPLLLLQWGWLQWPLLLNIIQILAWMMSVSLITLLIFVLVKLLSGPFFSMMSDHVLQKMRVSQDSTSHWQVLKMTMVSVREALMFLVLGLALFILSFIPGLQPVTFLGFGFLLAWDLSSYTFENVGMTYSQRVQFIRSHFEFYLGLSLALSLINLIPFFNLFLYPIWVVGLTHSIAGILNKQVNTKSSVEKGV